MLALGVVGQNQVTRELIQAVEQNDVKRVQALIKEGADVGLALPSGSPFYLFFLSREMYLNGLTKKMVHEEVYVSAIHANAMRANEKILKLLLKKKANIDAGDSEGKTPLMYALRSPGGEAYALLLIRKGANYTTVDQAGNTALHYAAFGGNLMGVQMTVTGGTDINLANGDGITPLHAAAVRAEVDLMQAMVDMGADLMQEDREGFTVLHYAAGYGTVDKLRWILEKAPQLNRASRNGYSPMDIAQEAGNVAAVNYLRQKGGTFYHYRHAELVEALKRRDFTAVKVALDAGANPNRKGERYPLHLAAELGDNISADHLLKAGADPELLDEKGQTALDVAISRGYPNTALVLLRGGAKAQGGQLGMVLSAMASQETPGSWEDVAMKLIPNTMDLNQAGGSLNLPPLHYAAYLGHEGIVDALLGAGARAGTLDGDGWTALHWAVMKRDLLPRHPEKASIARKLIAAGAPVDVVSTGAKKLPHTQPYMAKRVPAHASLADVLLYALPKDVEMAGLIQEKGVKSQLSSADFADNGAYFFQLKDYTTAMTELNKALVADPRNPKALFMRGECRRQLNILEEAERDYSEAIKYGDLPEAWMARGRTRYDLNQNASAAQDFDRVIQVGHKVAEAYYWRGKSYVKLGNAKGACEDLRKSEGLGYEPAGTAVKLYCK